jgi:hypothetical protein
MRLVLALVLGLALEARADTRSDALALARDLVEKHRTSEHRDRFLVSFPEAGAPPERGVARLEARTGRYEREETGITLTLAPEGARLVLVSRTHVPTFVARAAGKRDSGRLLECRVPVARARAALLALELLAGAHEKSRQASADPLDPHLDVPEATSDGEWPRLLIDVGGRAGARRGAFADLGRLLLEDLGKELGLAPPLERDAALRRLVPALDEGGDSSARAAFILGDAAFAEAWARLTLDTDEARDARAKIRARCAKDARASLLEASTRSPSWDVRAWARERLDRSAWIDAILAAKDAAEDPLVEALRALPRGTKADERATALLDDARPLVRIEAAAALLGAVARARDVLVAAARDPALAAEARETAIARLAASLGPDEVEPELAPVVTDASAPPSVRAEAARALDGTGSAVSALAQALEGELVREDASDEARRDLRLALIASLAGADPAAKNAEARGALSHAALASADEDVRRLAIHAVGSLEEGEQTVATALENESARQPASPGARRAAELETVARSKDEPARLDAIADAACEAPLRVTLARLARAARDPHARALLRKRLVERGELGEVGLEVLDKTGR